MRNTKTIVLFGYFFSITIISGFTQTPIYSPTPTVTPTITPTPTNATPTIEIPNSQYQFTETLDDQLIPSAKTFSPAFKIAPVNQNFIQLMSVDPETKLLLHFDGDLTDSSSSGHTVTANGNAGTVSTNPQFGSGCLYLDGNGDYLSLSHATAFDIAANSDFTIELWYKIDGGSITSSDTYYRLFAGTGNTTTGYLWPPSIGGHLATSSATTSSPSGNSTADGQWHHYALVRENGTLRVYLDGSSIASNSSTEGQDNSSFLIGMVSGYPGQVFKGWIDEFRFSQGVARYTGSTYTVPIEAFGSGGSPTNTPTHTPTHTPTFTHTPTSTPTHTFTPTPVPPTPTPDLNNIFTTTNFPDANFRTMVQYYMGTSNFTAADAAAHDGSPGTEDITWDFDEVTGVGDGDITDLTGIEFFTGLSSIRVNSSFTIILN